MLDASNTTREIANQTPEIAVWGIGAVEQHSVHLPLGTDWLTISDLAGRVAQALDAFLVPALPFSMSQCHGPMAGTVWLKPATLAAVLRDTLLSLHVQGIRKALVLNGHGGNFVLEAEIRQWNHNNPDLVVLLGPPALPPRAGDPQIWETGPEVHAGERETSSQAFLNPTHVKEERIDHVPPVGQEFLDYATMSAISPGGVWGYPSRATAAKGKEFTAWRAARIAQWAVETFARVEALRRREGA